MQQLYIYLNDQDASWAYCAEAGCLPEQIESGALQHLRLRDDELNIIVFVPTLDVLLASAKVPVKSRQKLVQAIPYALEEDLIDDVESLHVALGHQDEDGRVSTAVVSQQRMQQWLAALDDAGIEPDVMMPDALALPRVNGDWSALQLQGDIVCVRSGMDTGFACDAENLAVMASSHASECACDPDVVQLTNCAEQDVMGVEEQFKKVFSVPVNQAPCNGDALTALISGYNNNEGINLLQGTFARRSHWLKGRQRWLPVAVLFFTWLVLQFGISIYQVQKLAAVEQDYKDKIVQVFKQTFPDVRRVSDPEKQMAIKLKALRGTATTGGDSYLLLMSKLAQVFAATPAIKIKSMSYSNAVLDMQLEFPDLQVLENFKDAVINAQGISIDVKSTSQKKGVLSGLVQIRGES